MPISSGATGRVVVGADAAVAWTPRGKETKLSDRSNGSYLRRYLESTQRQRLRGDGRGGAGPPQDGEDNGITEKSGGSDGESEEKLLSDKSLRRSKTCTLL